MRMDRLLEDNLGQHAVGTFPPQVPIGLITTSGDGIRTAETISRPFREPLLPCNNVL